MIFDPNILDELTEDIPVAFHEAAHAVLWRSAGGIVRAFRLERERRGLLCGRTLLGCSRGMLTFTERNACHIAERMLAGESAARAAVLAGRRGRGVRRDRICSFGVIVDSHDPAHVMIRHLGDYKQRMGIEEGEFDITNVVGLAMQYANENWYTWVRERLTSVIRRVDENWDGITELAGQLVIRAPAVGAQRVMIQGNDLLDGLTVLPYEPGIEVEGELISVGSDAAMELGLTGEVFAPNCELFRRDGCVYIQIIEVLPQLRNRGHFTALLHRLWGLGYVVKVPNPCRRMELRLERDGFEKTDEPSLTEPQTVDVVYVKEPPEAGVLATGGGS